MEVRGRPHRSGRSSIPVGDAGQVVARNVARLRAHRGLSTRQLSAALAAAGRPVPASGITRVEQAERRVDVDDLVAFAKAFGVPPTALLGQPDCASCLDTPPPGFACTTCGAKTAHPRSS